jgi:hypothetical protein
MLDDFQAAEIDTGETSIFARWSGPAHPSCSCTGSRKLT